MQSFKDKCEAIKSLLKLIYFHLDEIPGAVKVQQLGEATSGGPPPEPYYLGCKGRCHTCVVYHRTLGKVPRCPPEELWVREAEAIRKRYRIADVEASLMRLRDHDVNLAQALWAVYVDPWPDPKTEPIGPAAKAKRDQWAEEGICWMAHDIRGDVDGEGDKPKTTTEKVAELVDSGLRSSRRIADIVGCSDSRVRHIRLTLASR